jgi:hypothetical protein
MCVLLCCSGRTAGRYRSALGGGQPRVPAVAGDDAAVAGDDAAVAGDDPAVAGDDPAVAGDDPAVAGDDAAVAGPMEWGLGGGSDPAVTSCA